MSEVIAVISGKGGVGKSIIAASLAIGISMEGKNVLLIDGAIGLRNLDIILGIQNEIVYDFSDTLEDRCSLTDAIKNYSKAPNLFFLSAPQSTSAAYDLSGILERIKDTFNYIIIDCPAGITHNYEGYADRVLIVANPDPMSVRDADKAAKASEDNGCKNINLVINKIDTDMMKSKKSLDIDSIVNVVAAPLIGVIPYDQSVINSVTIGCPIIFDKKSRAGKALINISKRILGQKVPILKDKRKFFN